ncbi:MAG: helix-turn-helix transcriptional regulator [Acetobacter sp.]|uniref:helix-turn-helix transcriptional regulator n=1 Tax=Acetobacter sp. TaxID=440 RepID=UPI003F92582F
MGMIEPTAQALPQLLSIKEVSAMLGVTERTVYRLCDEEGFPSKYKLSVRCIRWDKAEVTAWLDTRRTQKNAA